MDELVLSVGLVWGGCVVLALLACAAYGWWEDRRAEKTPLQG